MAIQERQGRVELASLAKGDLIRGIDESFGPDNQSFTDLLVVEPGRNPTCYVSFTNRHGTIMNPNTHVLKGSVNHAAFIEDPDSTLAPYTHDGVLEKGEDILLTYSDGDPYIVPGCDSFEVYPDAPTEPTA